MTPSAERLAMELLLTVLKTCVCSGWDSNTHPSACGANALTHCATAAAALKMNYICHQYFTNKCKHEPYRKSAMLGVCLILLNLFEKKSWIDLITNALFVKTYRLKEVASSLALLTDNVP